MYLIKCSEDYGGGQSVNTSSHKLHCPFFIEKKIWLLVLIVFCSLLPVTFTNTESGVGQIALFKGNAFELLQGFILGREVGQLLYLFLRQTNDSRGWELAQHDLAAKQHG